MPKTIDKGQETWEDWVKKVVPPDDAVGWFNISSKLYFLNAWVIQPTKSLGKSILRYIETDDPETGAEKIAFDLLEIELRAAALTLQMAKQQNINRRALAVSFWSEKDRAQLPPKARAIQLEAIQKTAKL